VVAAALGAVLWFRNSVAELGRYFEVLEVLWNETPMNWEDA